MSTEFESLGILSDLLSGANPLTGREQVVLFRQLRRASRHTDANVAQTARATMNDPDMFLVLSQNVAAKATPTAGTHPFLSWLLANLPAIINMLIGLFGGGKIPPLPPLPVPLPPSPSPSPTLPSSGDPPTFTPPLSTDFAGQSNEAVGFALPPQLITIAEQVAASAVQLLLPKLEKYLEDWAKAHLSG